MLPISSFRLFAFLLTLLTLAACGGSSNAPDEPDPPPAGPAPVLVSIADATALEGDSAAADLLFTVTLSAVASSDVSVDYASADGSADQADYTAVSGQLTIPAGQTSATIAVAVSGDTDIELDEDFTMGLTNPVNASLGTAIGVGTLENDDFSEISIADASVDEGNSGATLLSFAVTLDRPNPVDVTVDYASSDVTALAGSDYTSLAGTLTVSAGDTAATINIEVTTETDVETDEQLIINLLNPSATARIADDEAIGVIVNDDLPLVSIAPASVVELDTGVRALTLPLSLDHAATENIIVFYDTSDGTAEAGSDYTATSGSITVQSGDVSASISIDTLGDTDVENTEDFLVTLTSVQGPALLGLASASGSILDNDGPEGAPQLSGSSVGVTEGDAGTTVLNFTIFLSRVVPDDVRVDFATMDGSATAGQDYVAAAGTAVIAGGSTSVIVPVTVNGDTDEESNETFSLLLSNASAGIGILTPSIAGSIVDDDTPSQTPSRITISDASVLEGDSGLTDLVFSVTLDMAATATITADFATEDSSALAGSDYEAASGTVTFVPGETATSLTVAVIGDTFSEDDEAFRVRLSNITGDATFARSLANGRILTDEPLVRLSISDASGEEGDAGSSDQVFTVSLDQAAVSNVSFDFATADDTAIAGEDYLSTSGSLQILAGDTSADIAVSVTGDTDNEPDETYSMLLSNFSANAVVSNSTAIGTIVNDDGTPGWQTPEVIGDGYTVSLDVDSAGNAAAVFFSTDRTPTFDVPIVAARLSGGAWQTPVQVGLSSSTANREPRMARLGGGAFVVSWISFPTVESSVYTPGAGWAPAEVSQESGFYLEAAGNNSGQALVAWEGFGNNLDPSDIYRNGYESGSWGIAEFAENDDSGSARTPLVAIDDDGNRFVHWYQQFADPALSGTYFDYYDATLGAWNGATLIPELLFASNEYVGMAGPGRPAVAAQMQGFGNNEDSVELWIYDPSSNSWASAGAVETSVESAVIPEFAAAANGDIFVAWLQQPSSGEYNVWANRYDAASDTWVGQQLLENADGTVRPFDGGLDVAADLDGNAIVTWSQNVAPPGGFDFRIRASRYSATDGTWSPPEQIDDDNQSASAFAPRIGMDSSGNAVVVWYYDGIREVGAARYIAP